ncbi:MAG: carbohydrate binding family 9 domain-containing protein [Bacteroidetes bacterium]|nr:carbohydrate binding family 9 domain-containing protein [Bacteroidota bacterium]MCW5894541.1 carbohydrate binding family 9 domain-containing protein [Bacteroidota bacterium]
MKSLVAFALLLCPTTVWTQSPKTMTVKVVDAEILIDGILDQIWHEADSVADFFQLQPYFNQPPSQHSVAKVLSTQDALYCLMICYDTEPVRRQTGLLDQTSGDIVSIMLDTFNDRRTAYKFAVTSSGVRADCRLLDDARNRDYSWDGVWFADAKVYDWGFVVEMRIPYKSIKYDGTLTEWGLDFDRWMPSRAEDLYWCAYEQNEGQRISKFGKLVFDGFRPAAHGLNLEVYPVAIAKATYLRPGTYDVDPDAGIDIFYNPSQKLTFQLTANPDFAQIEADPFDFNISRYETRFDERRPFFTEGNEVFMASGRQRNSGFYRPLELFYSRRIGKILPDGHIVPVNVGTKAFGRLDSWEYGGFLAFTGARDFSDGGTPATEHRAVFGSARIKKQIFDNSSVGILFVGKRTGSDTYGVLDIDGAFRTSDWQLAYQIARSIENSKGSFAGSAGFTYFGTNLMSLTRVRAIDRDFDVQQVGFVPWKGTLEFVSVSGPRWFFQDGYISSILLYGGPVLYYEDADAYTDRSALLGYNMQFRDNWGFEVNLSLGRSKDSNIEYSSYEATFSSWFGMSQLWNANMWGGYSRTYNFSRDYLAFYSWFGMSAEWKALSSLEIGTSYNMWLEGNPAGNIEDITYNARPYVSFTPFNDLNFRLYVDNVFVRSSDRLERVIVGFLFSYNFLPKSWMYLAVNEVRNRDEEYDGGGNLLTSRMHLAERAAVLKVKYLYLF